MNQHDSQFSLRTRDGGGWGVGGVVGGGGGGVTVRLGLRFFINTSHIHLNGDLLYMVLTITALQHSFGCF